MSYVAIAGTVISAGTAAYGASQKAKAGKAAAAGQAASSAAQLKFFQMQAGERNKALQKMLKGGMFKFPTVDAGAAANQSLATTTRNLPGVIANTETAYDAAAANFQRYIRGAMGNDSSGKPAFDAMQGGVNDAVLSMLQGRLSEGTRALLGRRALATGATNLGRGAVQDAFTSQLGIASEEQVQRGIQAYGGLYEQYGRFAPNISPMDMLNYGGLGSSAALQNAQFNANGTFQARMAQVQAVLSNIDMKTQTVGSAIGGAAAGPYMQQAAGYAGAGEVGVAVGQGLAGIAGTYYGQQQAANSLAQTGMRYNAALGEYVPVYAPGARLNNSLLPSTYYLGDTEVRRALPVENQSSSFGGVIPTRNNLLRSQRQLLQPAY